MLLDRNYIAISPFTIYEVLRLGLKGFGSVSTTVIVITDSPAGLSRVNGVRRSSAKT